MSGKRRSDINRRNFNNEVIMKIIKTNRFLKKQAQFADSNLPPGVTDQMIDNQFGGGGPISKEYPQQSGQYETKVDWSEQTTNLINTGKDVQGLPQRGIGDIIIYYKYDAVVSEEGVEITSLSLLDIKILMGGKYQALTVSDPSTKQGIFEGFQDEIARQEKPLMREYHKSWEHQGPDRTEELY